jgi:hypothetical protein
VRVPGRLALNLPYLSVAEAIVGIPRAEGVFDVGWNHDTCSGPSDHPASGGRLSGSGSSLEKACSHRDVSATSFRPGCDLTA